jgi:hypothetical protein
VTGSLSLSANCSGSRVSRRKPASCGGRRTLAETNISPLVGVGTAQQFGKAPLPRSIRRCLQQPLGSRAGRWQGMESAGLWDAQTMMSAIPQSGGVSGPAEPFAAGATKKTEQSERAADGFVCGRQPISTYKPSSVPKTGTANSSSLLSSFP